MIDLNDNLDSPFTLKIGFDKLLRHYEELALSKDQFISNKAKRILQKQEAIPVLRKGFSDVSLLETYKSEIAFILQDSFTDLLTLNEIKTASVPFHDIIFNSSQRFKNILKIAGDDYKLSIKNMPVDDTYIIACTIILSTCYGYNLNFKRPFLYEIPDHNGTIRYYKILYNADFVTIKPKSNAPKITQNDINLLIDNFEDINLWKQMFPPNSYEFNGFVISNIFDVTIDQSISNIKTSLIGGDKSNDNDFVENFHNVFRSLFGLPNIRVGFSLYNKEDDTFERIHDIDIHSYLLNNLDINSCADSLCSWSYKQLLEDNKYVSISNIDKMFIDSEGKTPHIKTLHNQGIKSSILAPIANQKELLGVLELVSEKPNVLNSVNANKLVDVMPFIVSAVERSQEEQKNLIQAVIQKECTSIHPSVYWRFKQEAKKFIKEQQKGNQAIFSKISFKDVYPLYGQIDIKGSSEARNKATQQDLKMQLNLAKKILVKAFESEETPIYEQYIFKINDFLDDLTAQLQVDSEQQIVDFFKEDINTLFNYISESNKFVDEISNYFKVLDSKLTIYYDSRRKYDTTVTIINKRLSNLLDKKQVKAQKIYPHFFERFKTDGVEHNMYIGESITKTDSFGLNYLYNLRLWQLQVMCDMEHSFNQIKNELPIKLDVASLILVFNQPLKISFRMDEKQFDVDGTYNARYEVVKKRVDKALIKGTNKRLTEEGKITIVYSQKQDEIEYLKYISFLQSKNYLQRDEEIVELEDLQAVTGLKAIKVSVVLTEKNAQKAFYLYDDLIKEINTN